MTCLCTATLDDHLHLFSSVFYYQEISFHGENDASIISRLSRINTPLKDVRTVKRAGSVLFTIIAAARALFWIFNATTYIFLQCAWPTSFTVSLTYIFYSVLDLHLLQCPWPTPFIASMTYIFYSVHDLHLLQCPWPMRKSYEQWRT